MKRCRRTAVKLASLGLAGSLLTGCGSLSLQGVRLPGGAALGSDPYHVTVQLRDALDLVPQAVVRVNNVAVGEVTSIDLDQRTWNANVRLTLNGDTQLPANATATLKQTTLLGEKYIDLSTPTGAPAQGRLAEGAVVPVAQTNRYPEFEEVFGALSLLLNGGGIGQVQNIAQELNKALDGHEGDSRALLTDLNTLVGTLDGQRTNITRALDGVDHLSARLVEQRGNLDAVLTDLEPGLAVLKQQRPQLVEMLKSLDKLSDVATHVVDKAHKDTVADLEALRPTLRELAASDDNLAKSLEVLATPPFTDAAIKPTAGHGMNLNFELDVDLAGLIGQLFALPSLPLAAPSGLPSLPAGLNTLPTAPLERPAPLANPVPSLPRGEPPLPDRAPDLPVPHPPGGVGLPKLGGGR